MDIDRVRYFHVFSESCSLVRASEILHISQPALSKAMKILEQEVGIKLIEADGRGLRLTSAGSAFKRETSALLEQWLNVPKKISNFQDETPTKIGSFEVFTTHFLGHLNKFISLDSLDLYEFSPGKLEDAIIDGTIDLGITYSPIPKAGVEFIEVTKIRMNIYGLKNFKNKSLDELPFVIPLLPSEGTPSKVVGLDGWPDHRYARKIKYRVTLMESAIELCRQGLAVAYLPEFVVNLHNNCVLNDYKLHELESPLSLKDRLQSVYLIQKKNMTESKLHRQIAKSLRGLS